MLSSGCFLYFIQSLLLLLTKGLVWYRLFCHYRNAEVQSVSVLQRKKKTTEQSCLHRPQNWTGKCISCRPFPSTEILIHMEPLSELPVDGCSDVWEWAGRAHRQGRKQEDLSRWTDWPSGASGQPSRLSPRETGSVSFVFLLLCEWRAPASSATARNVTSPVAE